MASGDFDRLKEALSDRYELESEVGHGGMATVFRARDLRHNRQVAVKDTVGAKSTRSTSFRASACRSSCSMEKDDFFFPVESSQKPFFRLLGTAPQDKKYTIYEGGHFVPRTQLITESLSWLDKYLGPVK